MPGPDKAAPSRALARLRVNATLSPAAAAEALDIGEELLVGIESGTVQAPARLLANMARLYKANPHVVVKAYLADRR